MGSLEVSDWNAGDEWLAASLLLHFLVNVYFPWASFRLAFAIQPTVTNEWGHYINIAMFLKVQPLRNYYYNRGLGEGTSLIKKILSYPCTSIWLWWQSLIFSDELTFLAKLYRVGNLKTKLIVSILGLVFRKSTSILVIMKPRPENLTSTHHLFLSGQVMERVMGL